MNFEDYYKSKNFLRVWLFNNFLLNKTEKEDAIIRKIEKRNFLIDRKVKVTSEILQLKIIDLQSSYIEDIKNPTEAAQLKAVKYLSSNIQYIKNPTEKVQLESIKKCGYNIELIKNPSKNIQMKAILLNNENVQYLKSTKKIPIDFLKKCIKKNKNFIFYLKKINLKILNCYLEEYGYKHLQEHEFNFKYLKKYKNRSILVKKAYYYLIIKNNLSCYVSKRVKNSNLFKQILLDKEL